MTTALSINLIWGQSRVPLLHSSATWAPVLSPKRNRGYRSCHVIIIAFVNRGCKTEQVISPQGRVCACGCVCVTSHLCITALTVLMSQVFDVTVGDAPCVYEGMKVNTAGLPLSASNVFNIKWRVSCKMKPTRPHHPMAHGAAGGLRPAWQQLAPFRGANYHGCGKK